MPLNTLALAVSPRDLAPGALLLRITAAGLVTLGFAALARWLRGVTTSGAVAGATVAFLLYFSAGTGAFVALVCVFVLAVGATRFGYARKAELGTAERETGRRTSQVLANLGVATVAAIVFATWRAPVALIAMSAALAEAAADTVSSECGQALSDRARLITTWETVPAGTDGGISVFGSVAGIIAAAIVSVTCAFTQQIPTAAIVIACVSGVLGMLLDSVLGGLLERRRRLNNDQVNFLSTAGAAITASVLAHVLL